MKKLFNCSKYRNQNWMSEKDLEKLSWSCCKLIQYLKIHALGVVKQKASYSGTRDGP